MRSEPMLRALSQRLHKEARKGPDAYQKYLASDDYRDRFLALPPYSRKRAAQCVVDAEALCRFRDPLPPPAKPLAGRGAGKWGRWKDPAELARLRAAFVKAGPNGTLAERAERAGRILGVTTGAAQLAYQRHVLNVATSGMQQAA